MITVNILGTEYRIEYHDKDKDKLLENCVGYMDETDRLIVIMNEPDDSEILNIKNFRLTQDNATSKNNYSAKNEFFQLYFHI